MISYIDQNKRINWTVVSITNILFLDELSVMYNISIYRKSEQKRTEKNEHFINETDNYGKIIKKNK